MESFFSVWKVIVLICLVPLLKNQLKQFAVLEDCLGMNLVDESLIVAPDAR